MNYLDSEKNLDNVNIQEILPSLENTKYKNNATIKNNKIRIDSKNINLNENEKEYIYNNLDYFYLVTYATEKQYNIEIQNEEEKTCIISDIYEAAIKNKKLILPDYINFNNNIYKVIGNKYLTTQSVLDFSYVLVPETFETFNNLGVSKNFEEVFFEEGVTYLVYNAFMDCTLLNKVHLPNTLKAIGGAAFNGCKNLKELQIPYGVNKIDEQAFIGSSLAKVEMPDSITQIGHQLFQDCFYLEYVKFPKTLTTLPRGTFINSFCKEIKFPSELIEIEDSSLKCSKMSIEIPNGVKKMGNDLFNYNTKRIRIPDSVEEIGNFLCYGMANDDVSVYTDNPIVLEYLKKTQVTIKSYAEWNED